MVLKPDGSVDWDQPRVRGLEGPLPLFVFSKPEHNVALTTGCYSSIRCTSDFDAMYAKLKSEELQLVPWEQKQEVGIWGVELWTFAAGIDLI